MSIFIKRIKTTSFPLLLIAIASFFVMLSFPATAEAASNVELRTNISKNVTIMKARAEYMSSGFVGGGSGDEYDGRIPTSLSNAAFWWDDYWRAPDHLAGGIRDTRDINKIFHLTKAEVNGSELTISAMNQGLRMMCNSFTNLIDGGEIKRLDYSNKGEVEGLYSIMQQFENISKLESTTGELLQKISDRSDEAVKLSQSIITTMNPCLYMISNIYHNLRGGVDNEPNDLECLAQKVYPGGKVFYNSMFEDFQGLHAKGEQVKKVTEFLFICDKCEEDFEPCKDTKLSKIGWEVLSDCSGTCFPTALPKPDGGYSGFVSLYKKGGGKDNISMYGETIQHNMNIWVKKYDEILKTLKDSKTYYEDKEAAAEAAAEEAKKAALKAAQLVLKQGSVVGLSLPLSDRPIPELIKKVIQQILGIVGALGLVGFIYGGILYMTASGNTERAEKGRKTIVWSTMGLVVIFASYAIVGAIIDALIGK